jgi:ribosomal protein S18 acetylase RimI-like enzyme
VNDSCHSAGALPTASTFARAVETEHRYFEMGARLESLPGCVLASTPDFVRCPAASVIQRVDPAAVAGLGPDWLALVEGRLTELGIPISRIYLLGGDRQLDRLLADRGYACREEMFFAHDLPDPEPGLTVRPVRSQADWARKQVIHALATESPDGHATDPADLVALERHKCAHGLQIFVGETDGVAVGTVGIIWGNGIVRIKNLLVHPGHRQRSVATRLLSHVAALGRERGVTEQCLLGIKGGAGEQLYRSLGMRVIGSQFEWSRPLHEPAC